MDFFGNKMEPLTGDKLRGIAGAANELKSEKLCFLLYKWIDIRLPGWIDQSLKSFSETGEMIACEWNSVGSTYQEQRKLFDGPLAHRPADDGDITDCVIASRGQVEARLLARWSQYMDSNGTVPQPYPHPRTSYNEEMRNAFREAYVDWTAACIGPPSQRHATQALLVLSELFNFPQYTDLKVQTAATECRENCSLLGVEHDDLALIAKDTPNPKDSDVWLRLGSIYVDACIHIAGLPIERASEQMKTRNSSRAQHQCLRVLDCRLAVNY